MALYDPLQVADFGLAHALGDVRSKIQTKTYGTLTHQPPETLLDGIISKAVDVYSFGVLLWQVGSLIQLDAHNVAVDGARGLIALAGDAWLLL